MSTPTILLISGAISKALFEGEGDTEQLGDKEAEAVGRLVLANQERLGIRVVRKLGETEKSAYTLAFEEFSFDALLLRR
jgi:hypothetical protein